MLYRSIFACFAATFANLAQAQSPDPFYTGRTVHIIVGYDAGGGYDILARLLSRHIGRHLGGATLVVQNMPGAGSLVAANHIFNVAPRDGTILGVVSSGIPLEPLYGNASARFTAGDFSWIGNLSSETSTCLVRSEARVKKFDDLFSMEMSVGGTGAGADSHVMPLLLNSILGTKLKLVSGYQASPPIFLAMERRELDGYCGVFWSSATALRGDWIKSGAMKALVQLSVESNPETPDAPLAISYARTPADRQAMELVFGPMQIARPVLGPPGVAPERTARLRAAFDATMRDAAFLEEAARLKLDVRPIGGGAVEAIIAKLYATPDAVVARAKSIRN